MRMKELPQKHAPNVFQSSLHSLPPRMREEGIFSEVNVNEKLPSLYLIDSVVKNVDGEYVRLFAKNIGEIFLHSFERADERTRKKMYELRQTWNSIFPNSRLYYLDVKVHENDPAWPITAYPSSTVHVNPNVKRDVASSVNADYQILKKQEELIELGRKKMEIEKKQIMKLHLARETSSKQDGEKKKSEAVLPVSATSISNAKVGLNIHLNPRHISYTSPASREPIKMAKGSKNSYNDPKKILKPIDLPAVERKVEIRDPRLGNNVGQDTKHHHKESKHDTLPRDPRLRHISDAQHASLSPSHDAKDKVKVDKSSSNKVLKEKEKYKLVDLFTPDERTLAAVSSSEKKIKKDRGKSHDIKSSKQSYKMQVPEKKREKPFIEKKEHKQQTYNKESEKLLPKSEQNVSIKKIVPKNVIKLPDPTKLSGPSKSDLSKHVVLNSVQKSDVAKNPPLVEKVCEKEVPQQHAKISPKGKSIPSEKLSVLFKDEKKSESKNENADLNNSKKLEENAKSHMQQEHVAKAELVSSDVSSKLSHKKRVHHKKDKSYDKKLSKTCDQEIDSDESDHYSANKPNPSAYNKEKALTIEEATEPSLSIPEPSKDTDLRNFSTAASLGPSDENNAIKAINTDLFGKEDVDLRQLAPTHMININSTPSLPATFSSKDQDFREPISVLESELEKDTSTEELSTTPVIDVVSTPADKRNKRLSFSSPHAASWEKFREKFPEFRDYQRPSSVADSDSDIQSVDSLGVEHIGTSSVAERKEFLDISIQFKGSDDVSSSWKDLEKCNDLLKDGDAQWSVHSNTLEHSQNSDFGRWRVDRLRGRERGWPERRQEFHLRGNFIGNENEYFDEWTDEPELSPLPDDVLQRVSLGNETRRIDIDRVPREIRTYGQNAIILLAWNDTRTISFEVGHPCNVVFDGGKFVMPLYTGEDYKEFTIDGETHYLKLGVPTLEIFIDKRGYQCFFGGKTISVYLAGRTRLIFLDGLLPTVKIGETRNTNYLAGKVQMFVNTRKPIYFYLDATPQKFNIDGRQFVLKFVDSLRAVEINGKKFLVEFGGPPISISVRQRRTYLSFSALPSGIIPGQVSIVGMEETSTKLFPNYPILFPGTSGYSSENTSPFVFPTLRPRIPLQPSVMRHTMMPRALRPPAVPPLPRPPLPPHLFDKSSVAKQAPQETELPAPPVPPIGGFKITQPPSPIEIPVVAPNRMTPSSAAYVSNSSDPASSQQPVASSQNTAPCQPPIDVNTLIHNLVRVGIIGKKENKIELTKEEELEKMIEEQKGDDKMPLDRAFSLEQLRKRRKWIINAMYKGLQCSSCGLRYPTDQSVQYSNHLDWHFRMNKKQQDSTRKANTRKIFFPLSDWLQYEEIEDEDERVPSMFESEDIDEQEMEKETEEPSVPVASDDEATLGVCLICHDTFSQFFHQETEEWHYRNAIQIEGLNYHPGCYEDMKNTEEQKREAIAEEQRKKEEAERKHDEQEEKENIESENSDEINSENKNAKKDSSMIDENQRSENSIEIDSENKGLAEDSNMAEEGSKKDCGVKTDDEEKLPDEKDAVCKENNDISLNSIQNAKTEKNETDDVNEEIHSQKDEIEERSKETEADGKKEEIEERSKETEADGKKEEIEERSKETEADGKKETDSLVPSVRIKEEPVDSEEEDSNYKPLFQTYSGDLNIKTEIKEEPKDSEPEMEVCDVPDEKEMSNYSEDASVEQSVEDSWITSVPATTAETDIASSIDGNTELTSEDSVISGFKRIKISIAKPLSNPTENSHEEVSGRTNSVSEDSWEEFIPPPFTVDHEKKPGFKDINLIEQPLAYRGIEMSGLCSIM